MVRQLSGGAGNLYLKIAMELEIARICFALTLQSLRQQLSQGNQIMGCGWCIHFSPQAAFLVQFSPHKSV